MINSNMNILNILEKSLSQDEVESLEALFILQQNSQSNWKEFMMKLSNILSQRWNTSETRKAAGIQFRRELIAREGEKQQIEIDARWLSLKDDVRQWIKDNIVGSLGSDDNLPCPAAQCLVAIAAIEFPIGQWSELIRVLIQNVTNCKSSNGTKEASLYCISQLCQAIMGDGRQMLVENSNAILKTFWIGMKDANEKVVIEATNGLKNGLELFGCNFENESERELIMLVVCETAQCANPEVKIAAFRCLTGIALLYYEYIDKFMDPRIFAISTEALKRDAIPVRLEVIEFLRELCEIEMELKTRKTSYPSEENNITRNIFFTNKALTHLMPIFMELLSRYVKSSESYLEEISKELDETWDVYVSFLRELVSCCKYSNISKFIIDFGMKNIDKAEWKYRNAAVSALSTVVSMEANLLENFLPLFVQMMLQDENVKVRASSAYVIAKMCNGGNIKGLASSQILLPALVMGLSDSSEVALNVCESIGCLTLGGVETPIEYFEEIVEKLVELINRYDGSSRLHKSAACALYYVAGENRKKGHFAIHKIALAIMQHFRPGASETQSSDSLIYLHLSLENFLKHVTSESIVQICHMILAVLIINNTSTVKLNPQVVAVISTLIRELGDKFTKYMEPFRPFLVTLLQRDLQSAITVISEICAATAEKMAPYTEDIIKILISKLGGKRISLSVKNQILLLLGDFALALGPIFKIYMQSVIDQIAMLQVELDESHVNSAEFLHVQTEFHRHVLKTYKGILLCIEGDEKARFIVTQSILRGTSSIISAISQVVEHLDNFFDNFIPRCIEELTDVCGIVEPNMLHLLNTKPIFKLIDVAKKSESEEIRTAAHIISNKIKMLKNDTNISKNFLRRGLEYVLKSFSTESIRPTF